MNTKGILGTPRWTRNWPLLLADLDLLLDLMFDDLCVAILQSKEHTRQNAISNTDTKSKPITNTTTHG